MKANEAPEKLYIDSKEHWCKSWTAFRLKAKSDDIEYIRTDTFIKKAAKWINEHTGLSEKLVIENFVNYMKGE